jgi:hypothetical protein
MRFRCSRDVPVLLRFRTGNAARTAFELRKNGSADPIATDPDFDGNATFAMNPPGVGDIPADDYVITVIPTTIDGADEVPVYLFVEQSGAICKPIDTETTLTDLGYLVGNVGSDGGRDFWFRLLFVM